MSWIKEFAWKMIFAGGGGGASNVVTGTFKGTAEGAAIDVNVPYTGNGYPIAGVVYASGGAFKSGSDIATLVKKNTEIMFAFAKDDVSAKPTYSGSGYENNAEIISLYKYSDSDPATTTSSRGSTSAIYSSNGASAATVSCIKLKDDKTISAYIMSTTAGFPKDIEFTYHLIYSE